MTTDELDTLVETAVDTAKRLLEGAVREGFAAKMGPQIILVARTHPDGKEADKPFVTLISPASLAIDGVMPDKEQLMAGARLVARATNAYAAVTALEAWMGRANEEELETLPESLEDWPEHLRTEQALVMVETEASFRSHTAAIRRAKDGPATLEPWESAPLSKTTGRMTHIIPSNVLD